MEYGGNGFLLIMIFYPAIDIIRVTTYSTMLDAYLSDPENRFASSFEMSGGRISTGNVIVSDGTDSCVSTVEQGSCELIMTTAGEKTITATYFGDRDYNRSTSVGTTYKVEEEIESEE